MDLVGGAVDPRGGYVSKILHVKTEESGPVEGDARRARPLDPPMLKVFELNEADCNIFGRAKAVQTNNHFSVFYCITI